MTDVWTLRMTLRIHGNLPLAGKYRTAMYSSYEEAQSPMAVQGRDAR